MDKKIRLIYHKNNHRTHILRPIMSSVYRMGKVILQENNKIKILSEKRLIKALQKYH